MNNMKKRALASLMIVVFALLLTPLHLSYADISIDSVTPETGAYGDTIVVKGSGATGGVDVNLYWDAVKAWDGEKGPLNTTEVEADGSYEIWFEVPEAVSGAHYLWVKDAESGATIMYAESFGVSSILDTTPQHQSNGDISIDDVTPETGAHDDIVVVKGSGGTAGVEVRLYWDAVKAWDREKGLMNSTLVEADGSYEIWFEVPEAVGGSHHIWAKDTDTGSTARYAEPFIVSSRLNFTPNQGLPGDTITINGYGFGDEVKVLYIWMADGGIDFLKTSPSRPQTDELGSWTATFEVPDKPYGSYEINALDEEGNFIREGEPPQHMIFEADEHSFYYVPTGNSYDDGALCSFYVHTANRQIVTHPTQKPASDEYLDNDGSPLFDGDIVTFGGRFANRLVAHYEDAGIVLVGFLNNGTHRIFTRISDGAPIYAVDNSTYNEKEKDYFVFQIYGDGDRRILSEWGFKGEGTYAGGVCFKSVLLQNIQELSDQYHIYSWTDINDDNMPQPNEVELLTSG